MYRAPRSGSQVKILRRHPALAPEDHRPPDDGLELADVPAPRKSFDEGERLVSHPLDREIAPRVGVDADLLDQERDVLSDVAFRPCQAGARCQDALVDFLPATVLSTKPVILRHGLASETELDALIADCRQHLAKPTTVQTSVIVVPAWGRTPSITISSRCETRRR